MLYTETCYINTPRPETDTLFTPAEIQIRHHRVSNGNPSQGGRRRKQESM